VSTATYARRGLIPTTPVLRFQGRPRRTAPESLEPEPLDADALRFLDQRAYDRTVDHALWNEAATSATVWLVDGAAAYVSATAVKGARGRSRREERGTGSPRRTRAVRWRRRLH
jgi:hypothetical protein